MYSRWLRNSFIYLLILIAVIAIVFAFFNSGDDHPKVAFSQVVADAKAGKVDNATIITSLHQGSWPTLMGQLSWDAIGQPQGSTDLVQWIDGSLQVVYPPDQAKHPATVTKPAWGG